MLRSILVVALLGSTAFAQPKIPRVPKPPPPPVETPTHDMDGFDVRAKNRKIILITFLERASEELERASLKKRSFLPELIKTVDAEQL